MGKYTLELYEMVTAPNFELFDFEYDFYTDNSTMRLNFENKFIQRYMFHEIGQETVQRFKLMLQNRLNLMMPYYKDLYLTKLRVKDIDFMVNKDYVETMERLLENNNTSDINTSDNSTSNDSTNAIDNSKESSINNGISKVTLDGIGLTGESGSTSNTNSNSNSQSSSNQSVNGHSNLSEKVTNIGKGNIGVTSSADLLKGWREIIIDIDKMIIEELHDLFMLIY